MITINKTKNFVDLYDPKKLTYQNIFPIIDEILSKSISSGLGVYARVYKSPNPRTMLSTIRFELLYPDSEDEQGDALTFLKGIVSEVFEKF